MHASVEQRIVIKFLSLEGVKSVEILRQLTAQFAEKTLSTTQVYDWHKKFSDGRKSVQNKTCAQRPRTSTGEINIFAIRKMTKGDRLTKWKIAAHVGISYGSAQRLPKSVGKASSSPLNGRSESKPSCRVRKTGHDIERRGIISRGTLSSVMRRRCIIASRGLSRQAWNGENVEKQYRGKSRRVFLQGKFLQDF